MKYSFTIIIGLLAFNVSAQSLSFSEALDKMYGGNQKLKGIEKQQEASVFEQKSYRGLYFPQVGLSASYLHMSDALYLDMNGTRDKIVQSISSLPPSPILGQLLASMMPHFQKDWNYKFQEPDIFKFTADLKWVLYAGGKIRAANKVGSLKAEIANEELEKTENALISELAERYFQTQLAQSAIEVRQKALESAKSHYANAQKLEANGMIAPIETMQAERAVTDAERELLASQKDFELAQTALWGVIGGEQGAAFTKLSTELFEVGVLKPLEFYQQQAKENYPAIVQARLKKQMAEQNTKVQRSAFLPDVAVVGKKYIWEKNLPITEPNNWYVGVGLQWNLFNGFQDKNRISQAKSIQESAELLTAQAEKDIQTLVKKYYTEIQKQQEQLQSLEKSIRFAEELVRVRQKSFTEGFSNSTDVADANLYLAAIKIKRYQAMFEMDKTLAQLLETCGLSKEFVNYVK